jgi:hypothetical protein
VPHAPEDNVHLACVPVPLTMPARVAVLVWCAVAGQWRGGGAVVGQAASHGLVAASGQVAPWQHGVGTMCTVYGL